MPGPVNNQALNRSSSNFSSLRRPIKNLQRLKVRRSYARRGSSPAKAIYICYTGSGKQHRPMGTKQDKQTTKITPC
uniref:DNA mismatch repair protein MLH1-like n=1 Tax=Rhizophora mucronata TaxID=61149 RepID=A0A2P2LUN0_RHIMU